MMSNEIAKITQSKMPPMPEKKPEVVTELADLGYRLDSLDGCLKRLADRLSPILSSDFDAGKGEASGEPDTQVGQQIRHLSYAAQRQIDLVENLLARLEV